ncbi:MAG: hypothetical protein A2381_17235 [Bdellovibrionales bacterium RIFOXYB1_FULL_37_110]|nr:MAG: hypothetical protein A2181_08240 [Bdellovibrionales bacterium RIFOXYA1_FULL_38_20]OFZ50139.1 MAG: hypothetical protein A2417_19070 [Bdellovibrionales bacterium RIFOXYC1_FULL_37_79]OFZ60045.1 MAG: hypothetical protein A2381_17235 [Bdellovibrionales bacterium RIFOXYB1_FULL_37_110]OFZ62669.1 MAG: hypothetical protein A2577_16230 [Bdellovibrionales bacterium RIFOXYD1_FULL_36_51]
MNKFGLKDLDIELIIKIIQKYPQIKKVILFGSRAMGNYKPGSDIDLAICGNKIDTILTKLWGELENDTNLPYEIDLINLDDVKSEELKKHVADHGILIFGQ